jgi:hypothetical protein
VRGVAFQASRQDPDLRKQDGIQVPEMSKNPTSGSGSAKTGRNSGFGESIFGAGLGTDVMIFKIFSPKNLAKIFAFFAQTTVSFCENCDHNIGF